MRTTIGERVRTYRLRRGLTQARLAHLIGRSERWLIDVERGGVDPRLSDALALARELCVGVDDLAGVPTPAAERTGRPPPRPPVRTYHEAVRRGCRWLWRVGRRSGRPGGIMQAHRWGEGPDAAVPALSASRYHGDGPAFEAERLVRSRFAAWNRADSRALRAALHVPHVSLPGHRLSIRESELDLLRSPDFRAPASVEGWHGSAMDDLRVDHASADKAHCVVTFGRIAVDGTRYANGHAVYLVTKRDGRWGIQLHSATLRPIGVGGADDGHAVAAASDVLRRWVAARDGDDLVAERRLVHLPFVELDGARLVVHRTAAALRRDALARMGARVGRRSAVGAVRVRERSAHKVTLETEIARHGHDGSPVRRDRALVIVTHLHGRWALQVYSSFLTSPTRNGRG